MSNVCLFAADVLENGLVDVPDSPGEKNDPLASLQLNKDITDERVDPLAIQQENSESTPDFLGFSESALKKSARTLKGFTPSQLRSVSTSPKESSLRVSQPRSSKSKASLVWTKNVKYFETTIKKEPEDDVKSPTKATKKTGDVKIPTKVQTKKAGIHSEKEMLNKIKTENKKTTSEKTNKVKFAKNKTQNGTIKRETAGKKLKGETPTTKNKMVKTKQRITSVTSDRKKFRQKNNVGSLPSVSHMKPGATGLKKYSNTKNKNLQQKRKKTCFKCETCGRAYKYLRGLRQHKKLECNVEPQFPCPYCPSRFRYRQNIREHVRNYHEAAFPKWYATHYVMPVFDNIKT